MKYLTLKHINLVERGALDLELLALLLIAAIIISTTSSFSSAHKLRIIQKQKRVELQKKYFCEDTSHLTCREATFGINKRIILCKDNETKPICATLLEQ